MQTEKTDLARYLRVDSVKPQNFISNDMPKVKDFEKRIKCYNILGCPNLNHRMTIVVLSLSCPRVKGVPLGKADISFENKDAIVRSHWSSPRLNGAEMTN